MIRRLVSFTFKSFIPALLYYLILRLVPGLHDAWISFLSVWLVWVVSESFRTFPRLQLLEYRLKLWVINTPIQWNIRAEYSGEKAPLLFEKARKYLHDKGGVIETEGESGLTFRFPDNAYLTLSLARVPIEMDEDSLVLVVHSGLRMDFRSGRRVLNRWIDLFEYLRKGTDTTEKYQFDLQFEKENPYFGLFINLVGSASLQNLRFSVEFQDNGGRVAVRDKSLSIVARTPATLQKLSERYISLKSVPSWAQL